MAFYHSLRNASYSHRRVAGRTLVNKQQLNGIERAEEKEYKKGMADSPEDEAIRAQFEAQYGDGAAEDKKE